MLRISRFITLLAIAVIALSACNFPSVASPTPNPNAIFTAAAQTVEARLTESAPLFTSTSPPPVVTNTDTPPSPPTLAPTFTSIPPTPTSTQECDKAQFVKDVTVPDGTEFEPGETFTKTWRMKNVGTCSWTTSYTFVFSNGEAMSGPASIPLAGNVDPGQTVDISVDLKAPATIGDYTGYWKLRNSAGVLFSKVYVQIKVATSSSGFDLYSRASSAKWTSCNAACAVDTDLTFGGPDNDTNGFAMYRSGKKLEDGSTPSRVLETHPMWVNNGSISSLYTPYTVQAGDRLVTKLGFLAKADGSCGVGDVKFRIKYKEGGTMHSLDTWSDTCDGNLISVNKDLSSLAGHTVQFVLEVLANGSAGQDWAVWINPQITP